MAKQILNVGTSNNDKTGDTLRAGGLKIKANFEELYSALANDGSNISGGNLLKSGSYADLRNKPDFADIAVSGSYNDLLDKPNISTVVGAPTLLTGSDGDTIGNIAFDGNNLYVATSDYTDGQANIWKYVPWGGGGTTQGYSYNHNQDPTSTGGFSLDNQDPTLATVAYIATTDIDGNDIHPFYQYIFSNNLNANLEVISRTNPQNRALFKVTGSREMFANNVEYYELDLQYIMHTDTMTIGSGSWDLHFDFTGADTQVNKTWVKVIGNGNNSFPHWEDNTGNNLWFDVVCPLDDGTVVCGGGWGWGDTPLLMQFDKDGKVLWQWLSPREDYWGGVTSIAYDSQNNWLRVAISAYNGDIDRDETRLVTFAYNPLASDIASTWTVQSAAAIRDTNSDGDTYIISSKFIRDYWVGVGFKDGNLTTSASAIVPATGSGYQLLGINKTDIQQIGGRWPERNMGWSLWTDSDNGNTVGRTEVSGLIGTWLDVPFTSNSADGNGGRLDIGIDYNTNEYLVDASLWGSNYQVGDQITILGSAIGGQDGTNDLVLTVVQADSGMLEVVEVTSGTPQTDVIYINFQQWGYNVDFSTPGLTVELYVTTSTDPLIYSDTDEFVKINKSPNWGQYNDVVWNSTVNAYFAAGYASSNGNNGLVDKILSNGTVAWSLTGMSTVLGVATNGEHVYINTAGGESNTILCISAVDGTKVWETTSDTSGRPYGFGIEKLVYRDGYLYVAGTGGSMWGGGTSLFVEKIDINTGLSVWTRQISSSTDSFNQGYYFRSNYMTVTSDGIYLVSYGYIGTNNYQNAILIKLPLDGGPEVDVINTPNGLINHEINVFGAFDGVSFSSTRVASTEITLSTRNDLEFVNADITYDSNYSQNTDFPPIATTLINLTPDAGVDFGDGTPKASHNPVDVPETIHDWSQNDGYTLQLSDRGKFIKTPWNYNGNIYINVPTDAQVNFPIGSVITLINMWDWNDNSNYIYIQTYDADTYGQHARVYLAGQGQGYSPQWGLKGRGTATLMKVGPNEWLLTGSNIQNTD